MEDPIIEVAFTTKHTAEVEATMEDNTHNQHILQAQLPSNQVPTTAIATNIKTIPPQAEE